MSEIRVCNNEHDIMVPLIWTFAFMGTEFWCPVCGCTWGMLGVGEVVGETDVLKEQQLIDHVGFGDLQTVAKPVMTRHPGNYDGFVGNAIAQEV